MDAKMFGGVLTAAALILLQLGCGHTETRAVTFEAPRPAGGDVAVYASQSPPGGQELGEVIVRGGPGAGENDVRELYAELVRQARALGGNAIVIESIKAGGERTAPVTGGESRAKAPCGPDCDEYGAKAFDETMTIELRGKALRMPAAGPDAAGERRAP